jgi:uncharacterized protein (TIGR03435 family)
MLQNLLADRFKLVVRRDTRVSPVYAVVVAKLGPRLKKSDSRRKIALRLPSGLSLAAPVTA